MNNDVIPAGLICKNIWFDMIANVPIIFQSCQIKAMLLGILPILWGVNKFLSQGQNLAKIDFKSRTFQFRVLHSMTIL